MAEQAGVLGDVRLQFQDFFGSLSIAKRVTVLVSLLIVLVGMVSIIIISNLRQHLQPNEQQFQPVFLKYLEI